MTTAASIWAAAGLGAAIGCGLWQLGLMGTGLTLLTLSGVKRVRKTVRKQNPSYQFLLRRLSIYHRPVNGVRRKDDESI